MRGGGESGGGDRLLGRGIVVDRMVTGRLIDERRGGGIVSFTVIIMVCGRMLVTGGMSPMSMDMGRPIGPSASGGKSIDAGRTSLGMTGAGRGRVNLDVGVGGP